MPCSLRIGDSSTDQDGKMPLSRLTRNSKPKEVMISIFPASVITRRFAPRGRFLYSLTAFVPRTYLGRAGLFVEKLRDQILFGLLSNKLDSGDGDFVDVVHTIAFVEGQVKAIGHVDFYMNGGILQPGCGSSLIAEVSCSHQRFVEYFAESINTKVGFWGWRCTNFFYYLNDRCVAVPPFVIMGENVDKNLRGTFSVTVDTNGVYPFALGKQRNTYVITAVPSPLEYYFIK